MGFRWKELGFTEFRSILRKTMQSPLRGLEIPKTITERDHH